MVMICLKCGDKGFSNALVYCVSCLEVAVHRYCLDELPDTFDEFVHWVCDDCEVEVPQQLISLNSEPIRLGSRDYTNSKHAEPSFKEKSKRRKTSNLLLDSAEHMFQGVSSEQSYKVDGETKLTKSAELAGECSPLEVKQKACNDATSIVKAKVQISPRSLPHLDDAKSEAGLQHSQSLDADVPLKKIKTKKKKKKEEETTRISSSSEKFMQRLGYNSPYKGSCEAFTENNLQDHDDLTELDKKDISPSEAENKKHKKKKNESARNFSLSDSFIQRIGYSHSEQPCEANTKNNSNEYKEPTELEKKKSSSLEAKMEYNGHQSCDMNTELEVISTCNQPIDFSPLNKFNKRKKIVNHLSADFTDQGPKTQLETPGFGPSRLSNNVNLDNHELAQPLADPIWRGSFNILNKEYDAFEGMVAHLSRKACQKAYEEASLFPTLLDLEMHPKGDVWPKSFEKSEPSDDSIALYFFPMHKRYERMFDHLVEEMLNHELAMRVILRNAELLVFTSIELPLNYWRFQGKYYLWGVFRGKRPPCAQPTSNNHVGTNEG